MTAQTTADEIQTLYAEALALQSAGKHKEALRAYGRVLNASPGVAEAHYQIGRILTSENQFTLALPYLKEAVRLRPKEAAVWFAWADAVALGGKAEDEAELLRIIRSAPVIDPGLKVTLQDRFGAHRASTRPKTGGVPPARIAELTRLMAAGRLADAERAADQLVRKHPQSAITLTILGTARSRLEIGRAHV